MATQAKWKRGDFFLLGKVTYLPDSKRIRIWFENHEVGETSAQVLWGSRPGQPDWPRVSVDSATRAALLVPTIPGHPTLEGETAEIPADVIRVATDVDYRAYVTRRAADWAKRVGRELAQIRESRGFSQEALARAAEMEEELIAAVESGRIEVSVTTITRLLQAMGANAPDWLLSKTSR
jgi:DNA-binding XRE family transcriptional regulator